MFNVNFDQFYQSLLFHQFGRDIKLKKFQFIGGGCINNTVKLFTGEGEFFLKWNEFADDDMFQKEVKGLDLLRDNYPFIPKAIGYGRVDQKNYLLLEFVPRYGRKSTFWEDFGRYLALLHKRTHKKFGLDHDNYIGKLPQKNTYEDHWIDFFINNRLGPQIGLAYYNGLISKSFLDSFKEIYEKLGDIFPEEPPALLHGDLWSGNYMVGTDGNPFIVDPAVYFGHREIELSFTRLFGGFDLKFYDAYNEAYPLEDGFEDRIDIYNIYPLMVHVNLFGTSYLNGVERIIKRLKK